MNPQVEGAWIAAASGLVGVLVGITGTTIVAVKGFRNTRDATDKALRGARRDRLWDRRADVYQDTLAEALHRKDDRDRIINALTQERYDKVPNVKELLQTSQERWNTEGRLRAFGLQEVVEAFKNTMAADDEVNRLYQEWQAARQKESMVGKGLPPPTGGRVPDREAAIQAAAAASTKASAKAFEASLRAANDKASELEQVIRNDLEEESDGTGAR
jgi:hypothetical protein